MLTNSFEGVRESLPPMRKWVRDSLNVLVDSSRIDHSLILIAVGEVLQNCIRYGFERNGKSGCISISFFSIHYGIAIEVEDDAPPSDPKAWATKKEASEGGLGLITVSNASSAVTYRALSVGNSARLVFLFPEHEFDQQVAAWVGDIYVARQKPYALLDYVEEGLGESFTIKSRALFEDAVAEILEHIEAHREKLFYHNEWHIQDVVISMVHLLKASPKLNQAKILECLIAAIFHDHLHPGMAALKSLPAPIENVSADMARKFLEKWSVADSSISSETIDAVEMLILSTEPGARGNLYRDEVTCDDSRQYQKFVLNDADILVSLIPAMGLNMARALKYEGLMTDTKSVDLYKRFASGVSVATEQAKALVSQF